MDEIKKRIGFLRLWLNESRIDDPKKMVTNEELEYWLLPEKMSKKDCHKTTMDATCYSCSDVVECMD